MESLSPDQLSSYQLIVIGEPHEMFSENEIEEIKRIIESGKSVFILMGEGGESKINTNINYLIEQFGICVNSDSVLRTTYYKYLHPKEVLVSNGVLNREFNRVAKGLPATKAESNMSNATKKMMQTGDNFKENLALNMLFPFGSTLNVQKPSYPLISSGPLSYPVSRPVAAFYTNKNKGKLFVLGSVKIFEDEYIEKEDNPKIIVNALLRIPHLSGF